MTFKDIFYSLLIPHICAGFYIQTPKQQPQSSRNKIINHIIYALVTLIIPKVISANIEWRYLLAIIIFHSLISVFISLAQNLTKITQKQVFITEHFLHMLTLVFISYRMIQSNKTYQYITLFIHAENITEIPTSTIISFITIPPHYAALPADQQLIFLFLHSIRPGHDHNPGSIPPAAFLLNLICLPGEVHNRPYLCSTVSPLQNDHSVLRRIHITASFRQHSLPGPDTGQF